jgi:hypothetical protein
MGLDTFEDSLAVSESAALRLGYPEPLEVGDKLSNRSGNKGVVARIVPDAEMPRLEDGTPVELAMSPNSIYSRMTLGQLREAALSWAAHRRGAPIVFPPLSAPTRNEMDTLLEEAGLLADGMLPLVDGRTCRTFERPATVGWVYWGKLTQRASKAHFASASLHPRSQRWGASEFDALRLAGADAVIRSVFGVQASDSPAAQAVADRVAEGADPDTGDAMPVFARLQRRLARTGIRAELVGGRVRYCLSRPDEPLLKLAMPLPHPWLPAHTIEEVGAAGRMPAFQDLVRANARAERMLAATAPEGLKTQALDALKSALAAYFDTMVGKHTFRITGRNEQSGRLAFSARAVATPGDGLAPDQVGIPEAMAWSLFAPFLVHAVGVGAVEARSAEAAAELDRLMARMWVLVHRHPTTGPSSILAFHPIRVPGRVIRIHPMACVTLNADFDGDVLGVVLPVTEAAQEQAGRALTIAAHVEKDRASGRCARPVYEAVFGPMTHQVRPTQDSRFGLARLCMTPEGLAEVAALSGVEPVLENGMLTTSSVCGMLDRVLAEKGVAPMLEVASKLWYRGLAASRDIGASLTPFPTAPCEAPPKPDCDDVDAWAAYQDEYAGGMMAAYWDCRDDTDPARVTLLSGARGTARMWIQAVGVRGVVRSADGGLTVERHSVSEGLTPEETLVGFVGMRHGLTAGMYWVDMQKEMRSCQVEIGYGVLERALRSNRPGVVFARAAAAEEHDRLDTVRSRLMVSGLSQR